MPDINGKLTIEEKMINSFLILLTEATPVNQLEPPPCLMRLYIVRIIPKAVAYKKKAMRGWPFPSSKCISKGMNYAHLNVT